jgi:hypothetical protein
MFTESVKLGFGITSGLIQQFWLSLEHSSRIVEQTFDIHDMR